MKREPHRTKLQKRADAFDCDLFRLICHASDYACKDRTHRQEDRAKWDWIATALRSARHKVRDMMHDVDIERTT